ncbi:hypothetical protein Vadar_001665 [Vaccinium darrowii]|uniref:Uncharacterized protein n=1 Tax=Vaccinium darrowii TaxID=229202 RepID=A0ACB7YTB5_9ERIC|nr:hypothetical protein Vadar_001665 [Vaccinium darrowii]
MIDNLAKAHEVDSSRKLFFRHGSTCFNSPLSWMSRKPNQVCDLNLTLDYSACFTSVAEQFLSRKENAFEGIFHFSDEALGVQIDATAKDGEANTVLVDYISSDVSSGLTLGLGKKTYASYVTKGELMFWAKHWYQDKIPNWKKIYAEKALEECVELPPLPEKLKSKY